MPMVVAPRTIQTVPGMNRGMNDHTHHQIRPSPCCVSESFAAFSVITVSDEDDARRRLERTPVVVDAVGVGARDGSGLPHAGPMQGDFLIF